MKIFILVLAMVLIGCGQERLNPLMKNLSGVYTYGTVDAHFCTDAPQPAQQKIKYLFVIDHSASNQPGFPLSPSDIQNTDSNGARRYGPMINFLRNLVPDPNNITSYNLINFNDVAYQPQASGNVYLPFESDTQAFINRANRTWMGASQNQSQPAPLDAGFTNYQSALNLAQQLIREDAQLEAISANTVQSSYRVIFVSDGIPEVGAAGGGTIVQDFNADIRPQIVQIKNLKNDPIIGQYISNIVLSTAYYFNDVPVVGAQTMLQQIANEGNGQYLEFGAGNNVLYQQFAPPSRNIRNQLIDVFVENVNGLFWDNGAFMLETDGDGLPDIIENQQGSNVAVRDSDGNGVSDLVEYRTKGRACDALNCAQAGRDRYAICAGFSPVTDAANVVTFVSSTNDGFNDCEKYLLNASRITFNTNGNFIPDQYAYKTGFQITAASGDSAFSDPFGDGLTNYQKMKLGLPIQISSRSLIDYELRETNLTLESSPAPDVNCYHLLVTGIALSSINDTMRVMIVQNGSALTDKPFLKTAVRRLGQGQTANFSPGDFR